MNQIDLYTVRGLYYVLDFEYATDESHTGQRPAVNSGLIMKLKVSQKLIRTKVFP